jgi:hypothetical protein
MQVWDARGFRVTDWGGGGLRRGHGRSEGIPMTLVTRRCMGNRATEGERSTSCERERQGVGTELQSEINPAKKGSGSRTHALW